MPYLKIVRPVNIIFVSITILFGGLFRNQTSFNLNILFAILSAASITAAGYVINDFFDLRIDLINRPDRMIPAGKISPKAAYLYSVFLFVIGIILSYLTANIICVAIAIFNSLLLFYYAKNLKRSLLIGNLIVSYSAASCFIFGGLAAGNTNNVIFIAVFAFLFTFIREIIKDAEDMEGDKNFRVRSLAIIAGKKAVLSLSATVVLLIFLLFIYLYSIDFLSTLSLGLGIVLITLPLLLILLYLKANIDSKQAFSKSSSLLKLEMFMLLIIVLIGN